MIDYQQNHDKILNVMITIIVKPEAGICLISLRIYKLV